MNAIFCPQDGLPEIRQIEATHEAIAELVGNDAYGTTGFGMIFVADYVRTTKTMAQNKCLHKGFLHGNVVIVGACRRRIPSFIQGFCSENNKFRGVTSGDIERLIQAGYLRREELVGELMEGSDEAH